MASRKGQTTSVLKDFQTFFQTGFRDAEILQFFGMIVHLKYEMNLVENRRDAVSKFAAFYSSKLTRQIQEV